jgi:hypothetical protein
MDAWRGGVADFWRSPSRQGAIVHAPGYADYVEILRDAVHATRCIEASDRRSLRGVCLPANNCSIGKMARGLVPLRSTSNAGFAEAFRKFALNRHRTD